MSTLAVDQAGRAGSFAMTSVAEIVNRSFEAFERFTRLNLQTVKTALAEQEQIAQEAVATRSLEWVVTLPAAQAQAAFKKMLAYWGHVNNIATETTVHHVGASLETANECAQWAATLFADAADRSRSQTSLVLASPEATLPVPVDDAASARGSSKKRAVEIVDGSGNVVSSTKQ